MMDQFMDDGAPSRNPRSAGRGAAILAMAAVAALTGGCRTDLGRKAPHPDGAAASSDDWKRRPSPTVGTDFNKVPPGQTISAPLGIDLP